jgi:hypothetical protein
MKVVHAGCAGLLWLITSVPVGGQTAPSPSGSPAQSAAPAPWAVPGEPVTPLSEDSGPAWPWDGGDPSCGPDGRIWVSGEYLLWWIKNGSVPPLVTTSPQGTPRADAGVLPGARVLFGGSDLDNQLRSGGRFTAGAWLDRAQTLGVEGSFFFLGERSVTYDTGFSPGSPILGRPVVNAATGQGDAELVAFPGLLGGSANVSAATRLLGAEGNLLWNLACRPGARIDLLGGYRFLRLDESLGITENLTVLAGPSAGSRIIVADRFGTRNDFHGGQVGARAILWRGPWELGLTAKAALGASLEEVDINGQTTFLTGGASVTQVGGLLALPSNIGHYRQDRFAVVPEGNVRIGYHFTERLLGFVGYTFLYVSDVARPGDQIDLTVNRSQIPSVTGPRPLVGVARPQFNFEHGEFWTQGISLGLQWRF